MSENEEPKQNETNTQDDQGDGKSEKTFTRAQLAAAAKAQGKKDVEEFKANELPKLVADAVKKAQDEAKLSADEKAKKREKERQQELDAREAKLDARDALSATKTLLADKGLPASFASMLSDTDEDKRKANVETFYDAYTQSVDKKVRDQAKGKSDPKTGGLPKDLITKKWSELSFDERVELYRKDPDEYQRMKSKGD